MRRLLSALALTILAAACNTQPPSAITIAPTPTLIVPAVTIYPTATSAAPSVAAVPTAGPLPTAPPLPTIAPTATPVPLNPLTIESMRQRDYPGSDMEIEQELARGSNYRRYIASYESDGLKIYGLLTVPEGEKLPTGWPVIIFNHGYIPPSVYRTTERYVAYVDALARSGYIVFKPDYRGHANSEGVARGGYETPDYAIDVLNALASLKRYKDADSNRIGMWGHSMGGQLTLRSLVVSKDIKAAVIWAGVVAPYADLIEQWKLPVGGDRPHPALTSWRDAFLAEYGSPQGNPDFWASISPSSYATDITAPVQVHHGSADEDVPMSFSDGFVKRMQDAGKAVEYFTYPGDNHNLSVNFSTAMRRTIAFFDSYLKGE